MPAEKLPTDEACRLLNIVEAGLQEIPPARAAHTLWPREKALREVARYQIHLERDSGECCECRTADVGTNCVNASWGNGFVYFSRPMCATCHGVHPGPYRWPRQPDPATLTPNVTAWLAHWERQRPRVVEREYD
jgi:hypothetical protein